MIRKGEKITEMLRKERERVEKEKQLENEKKETLRKEKEKKEKLMEKQEKLKQYWAMHKWVTGYIADNQENWEKSRNNWNFMDLDQPQGSIRIDTNQHRRKKIIEEEGQVQLG